MVALGVGTIVGRYRIKAALGAGGMGVVYRAEDPELGRDVALKLLRGDRAGEEEERRLVREGQALARVSHPNVITVHDVGTNDGRVFVAMELVDGTDLRSWLATRARSLAEVLAVLAAAGRGLAAAHAAGLIHRDFKPDNVLVGRDGRVRVTDFGLARRERAPGPVTSGPIELTGDQPVDVVLTRAGALVGSPAYMAPEQLAGDHVDARSDQFGFCVTLHEALYGVRPFAGKNLFELEDNVNKGVVAPPPPGRRVPGGLRAIALRGLSVRPGDRFPSMDHLLSALGRSRARGLRVIAAVAASLALAAGVGLFADWLARERQLVGERAAFTASALQFDRALYLRNRSFGTLATLSRAIPLVRDVTGNRDQADFGLGSAEDDRARLQELHDGMKSADWFGLISKATTSVLALSDYKGRLIYTGADPDLWGADVTVLDIAARAMSPGVEYTGGVLRGDAPALLATGITGGIAKSEGVILLVQQFSVGNAPQGLFMQVVYTGTLLDEVALGDDTLVAIVNNADDPAPMPRDVLAAGLAAPGAVVELARGDGTWFVHDKPLVVADTTTTIGHTVMARPVDATGLFAGARVVLGALLGVLLALGAATLLLSRRSARLLGAVTASADASDAPVAAKRA